jgi:hypothetical protein
MFVENTHPTVQESVCKASLRYMCKLFNRLALVNYFVSLATISSDASLVLNILKYLVGIVVGTTIICRLNS